jgi:hypothetical protein
MEMTKMTKRRIQKLHYRSKPNIGSNPILRRQEKNFKNKQI